MAAPWYGRPAEGPPQSIYAPPNKYGYRLTLRHPLVAKLYARYKAAKGIPHWCPLSDSERFDFEAKVIAWWEEKRERKDTG